MGSRTHSHLTLAVIKTRSLFTSDECNQSRTISQPSASNGKYVVDPRFLVHSARWHE